MRILVSKVEGHFRASCYDQATGASMSSDGATAAEAIGALVVAYPSRFGVVTVTTDVTPVFRNSEKFDINRFTTGVGC